MFQNMDRALRQQLLGAVEENFICVLHRLHLGYSRSTTLDMLTHIYATYVVITNANWIANNNHFCKDYAPTNPIKVIWWQINDAVEYANAGSTPYSSKQFIDNTYQLVFSTGIFAAYFWE